MGSGPKQLSHKDDAVVRYFLEYASKKDNQGFTLDEFLQTYNIEKPYKRSGNIMESIARRLWVSYRIEARRSNKMLYIDNDAAKELSLEGQAPDDAQSYSTIGRQKSKRKRASDPLPLPLPKFRKCSEEIYAQSGPEREQESKYINDISTRFPFVNEWQPQSSLITYVSTKDFIIFNVPCDSLPVNGRRQKSLQRFLYDNRIQLVTALIPSRDTDIRSVYERFCLTHHPDKSITSCDTEFERRKLAYEFALKVVLVGENVQQRWQTFLELIYEYKIGQLSADQFMDSIVRRFVDFRRL